MLWLLLYCGLITAMTSSLGALLIPNVAVEFDLGIAAAQWIVTSSLLAGAVSTPLLGHAGDGRWARPVLLAILALIVLGSILCALAPSYPVLLAGRVLQGLTFGVVPVCINLARQALPSEQVPSAVSALSVTTATGVGIGFPLTGLLADLAGFRVAFLAALVVQVPALLLAWRWLDRRPAGEVASVTLPTLGGTVLFVVGMVLLVSGVSGTLGSWGPPCAAAGAFVLALWLVGQARVRRPLLRVRLLRHPQVAFAHLTALCIGAAMHIAVVSICQVVSSPPATGYGLGASLFLTGCFVLPLSLGSQAASRVAARGRHGPAARVAVGAAVAVVGNVLAILGTGAWPVLLVSMAMFGVGIGLCWAASPPLILAAVPAVDAGAMLAFNQILRPLGGAVGTALAGWLLSRHEGTSRLPTAGAYDAIFVLDILLCAVVLGCALVFLRWGPRTAEPALA